MSDLRLTMRDISNIYQSAYRAGFDRGLVRAELLLTPRPGDFWMDASDDELLDEIARRVRLADDLDDQVGQSIKTALGLRQARKARENMAARHGGDADG